MTEVVAFVSYEVPQFPCGGIAAVLGRLPGAMSELTSARSIVIAPKHVSKSDDNKIRTANLVKIGSATCRYRGVDLECSAWHLDGAVQSYFVGPESILSGEAAVFAGQRHPYDVDALTLLRDALLFGAIVVALLPTIGSHVVGAHIAEPATKPDIDWRLVMQDWEAATVALVAAQSTFRGTLHLVLHNSYDCFVPATDQVQKDGSVRPGLARFGVIAPQGLNETILQRTLPLVEQPVFTVSEQFAQEFTTDMLQVEVMAPHLQKFLLKHPILGVDNGPFMKLHVPHKVLDEASQGMLSELREWKAANRIKALDELQHLQPTSDRPVWGDPAKFRKGTGPWFVMAGRDDPRQKGYDVAALAVHRYLEQHASEENCAQFLFFPIPGDEGRPGLYFLQDLATRRSEFVLALPFRWSEGYMAALQASSYGLMPSLYEPFGMANEFYLGGGCVGIGRATGGNLEQIVPLWATRSCNAAVRERSRRFHSMSSPPTGLLFREPDDLRSTREDWEGINKAKYATGSLENGRVRERSQYLVFDAMSEELRWSIEDGIRILDHEPTLYARMLAAGVQHILQSFSWIRAAQEYARYIDRADSAR